MEGNNNQETQTIAASVSINSDPLASYTLILTLTNTFTSNQFVNVPSSTISLTGFKLDVQNPFTPAIMQTSTGTLLPFKVWMLLVVQMTLILPLSSALIKAS